MSSKKDASKKSLQNSSTKTSEDSPERPKYPHPQKKRINRNLMLLVPLIIALVFLLALMFMDDKEKKVHDDIEEYIRRGEFIEFGPGFYEQEKADIFYRWSSGNDTIRLVVPYDQIVEIDFIHWSYNEPKNVDIYLNSVLLDSLESTQKRQEYKSPNIYLKRGIYSVRFDTKEGCEVPALVESSVDTRCLAIGIGEFKHTELKNMITDIDTPGWNNLESYYGKEFRWIEDNAVIDVFNLESSDFELDFYSASFYFERELEVLLDNQPVTKVAVPPIDQVPEKSGGININTKMHMEQGLHVLSFKTTGCDRPSRLGVADDNRCLSVAIIRPLLYQTG